MTAADVRPARRERLELCELAAELGPAAPTLCTPWTVADLLAHLVLRERRPDLAAGMMVPPLAGRLERSQSELAMGDFDALVGQVREGAPWWHPTTFGPVDDAVNLVEMFVHHEDIRRANDLGRRAELDPALGRALGGVLRRIAPLLFRRAATGVRLEPTIGRPIEAHRAGDRGLVTLAGDAGELILWGYGRARVAEVVADGSPADVLALTESRLGLI